MTTEVLDLSDVAHLRALRINLRRGGRWVREMRGETDTSPATPMSLPDGIAILWTWGPGTDQRALWTAVRQSEDVVAWDISATQVDALLATAGPRAMRAQVVLVTGTGLLAMSRRGEVSVT